MCSGGVCRVQFLETRGSLCSGAEAHEHLVCRRRPFIKDPTSLIPQLPKPQDLRPFPYKLLLRFLGHKGSVCSPGLLTSTACFNCASDYHHRLQHVARGFDCTSTLGTLTATAASSSATKAWQPHLHAIQV